MNERVRGRNVSSSGLRLRSDCFYYAFFNYLFVCQDFTNRKTSKQIIRVHNGIRGGDQEISLVKMPDTDY